MSEPPSVSLSFANNFWGKDDAGVGPMLDRMHYAKVTNDELKSFYLQRLAIEDEYSRKLLNLSRKPLGSTETGTLKLSCDVIRAEVESMGKAHQNVAQQMKTELEEPLAAFAGGMKERRKIVQNGIEKVLKLKMQQTGTVNKARDRYEQDCLKIKGFLAQAHMVMGHEERKNKAKLEKTQINLTTTSAEYEAAVKVLEETTGRWNRDWKAACDKFQDLEEERIDFTKSSLWSFANIASTVCVSDDASCEKIRLSLEDCDVEKDITSFIKDSGTGQEIPDPPKFINFCRGDAETSSQVSDDDNYCVAQFARTMNPAYRASSPPISVFESHHDPNNPLARELGLQQDTQPILGDQVSSMPKQSIEQQRPRPSIEQQRPRRSIEQHRSRQSIEQQRVPPDLQRQYTESPRQFMESPQPPIEPLRRQHTEPPQQFIEPQRQYSEPPQSYTEPQRQYAEPMRQYNDSPQQYNEPHHQYNEPHQQYKESHQQYNESHQQYDEPHQQYNEPLRRHTTEQIPQHIEPPMYPTETSRQSTELSRQYAEPPQHYPEPMQRQHTEPPRPFVESPRQSLELQRHRPEPPRPFVESARQSVELQRHRPEPVLPAQLRPASRGVQPDPRLIQAQQQLRNNHQESQVTHNDYPSDGMTQFSRIGAPSDRSTIPSPARPATADSVSEYSNPTSFSSIEPPSGSASPGKPLTPQSPLPEPSPVEETSVAKRRSFFQNSPFRRKSKHEKEAPVIKPSNRNTWAPAPRQANNENTSPTRPFSRGTRRTFVQEKPRTASPEPVDPRANFQLNVGNNVFDVASPDKKKNEGQEEQEDELDPIALALEELRVVTKQTSLRVTADRFHGLATPQPPPTPAVGSSLAGSAPTPLARLNVRTAKESTPPPSYEPPSAAQLPAAQLPAAQLPAALRPASQRPVSKPSVMQRPVLQRPISKAAISKPAVPQSPIAQSPIAQSPIAQLPIAQLPIAQSPIAQSPVQQTAAPQSPLPQPRMPQSPAPQSPKPQMRAPQSPISQPRAPQSPISQPRATQSPASKPLVSRPPVSRPPVSKPPVSKPPVSKPPVTKPPVSKPPVSKPPVSKPPVSKPPVAQQPVPQQPVPQQPVPQQPVPQQPVPQQPVAQPPMSRLGAPKPAHTARQMQKTTQMYVNQTANVLNGNDAARPSTRGSTRQEEPPRSASPAPARAISPRPSLYNTPKQAPSRQVPQQAPSRTLTQQTSSRTAQQASSPSTYRPAQQQQQPPPSPSTYRPASRQQQPSPAPAPAAVPAANFRTATASPNPYAASNAGGRPRAQTNGSISGQAFSTPAGRNSYSAARGPSPSVNNTPMPRAASPQPPPQPTFANSRPTSRAAPSSRAASPQPQFRQSNERPSTRGSERSMNMAPSERGDSSAFGGSVHGGSVHGGSVYSGSVRGRPQSVYHGATGGSAASIRAESRTRSKSLAEPKNYNRDGRIILNYSRAMYSYTAQIPEELGFMKGDILAVLRLQDDGWWEAEAVGKNGRPGLVPSNYLQAC